MRRAQGEAHPGPPLKAKRSGDRSPFRRTRRAFDLETCMKVLLQQGRLILIPEQESEGKRWPAGVRSMIILSSPPPPNRGHRVGQSVRVGQLDTTSLGVLPSLRLPACPVKSGKRLPAGIRHVRLEVRSRCIGFRHQKQGVSVPSGDRDREPDFHLIKPRCFCWHEVAADIGVASEPAVIFGLMGAEVVESDMYFAAGIPGDDPVHEVQKLDPAPPFVVTH